MRTAAACLRSSPRANASEDPLHLENEAIPIEDHEDRRREKEVP
jgi:hypothetical protein